ncbi:hypothetical protein Lepto7375DRAFT_6706 [Leptolyngbya sp. PCC 7375]|nr:hypothetical protein Lepto7375DRAFT_6706 [Leptolyngbya sp. PCC 7375]
MVSKKRPSKENKPLQVENTDAQATDAMSLTNDDLQETSDPVPSSEAAAIDDHPQVLAESGADEEIQAPESVAAVVPKETPTQDTKSLTDQPWSSVASFRLEFQSRKSAGLSSSDEQYERQVMVKHMGGGQKGWAQLDDDEVYAWILDQVKGVDSLFSEDQSIISQPTLEITQVRFLQPALAGMVVDGERAILNSVLRSNDPVALEVSFQLTRGNVADLAGQALAYQIQGNFHNLMTGMDSPLREGPLGHLVENQRRYTVRLPEVTLSPGSYRLQMATTLQHSPIAPAMFEVPILQVI